MGKVHRDETVTVDTVEKYYSIDNGSAPPDNFVFRYKGVVRTRLETTGTAAKLFRGGLKIGKIHDDRECKSEYEWWVEREMFLVTASGYELPLGKPVRIDKTKFRTIEGDMGNLGHFVGHLFTHHACDAGDSKEYEQVRDKLRDSVRLKLFVDYDLEDFPEIQKSIVTALGIKDTDKVAITAVESPPD